VLAAPVRKNTRFPIGFTLSVTPAGQTPFVCWWRRNGVPLDDDGHYSSAHTTNLVATGVSALDTGAYKVVVSNAFGMATSAVTTVSIYCADAAGTSPVPPYADWSTAATNIQDAIDAASDGDFVLVTNGVYAFGGKAMAGDLTNRVALDKPLTVLSVNGFASTTLLGDGLAPINGPSAVRCAWLADGATLCGFTLRGGATRTSGDSYAQQSGGGVWAVSTDGWILNCLLTNNAANYAGGASFAATLVNCFLVGNSAQVRGGAACNSALLNCTVTGNSTTFGFGAVDYDFLGSRVVRNSIVVNNSMGRNYSSGVSFSYSCTSPLPPGAGNINADPLLLDGLHLGASSACRAAGNPAFALGTDLDGEPWGDPPSIGCEEALDTSYVGPIRFVDLYVVPTPYVQTTIFAWAGCRFIGRASRLAWSLGDGTVLTNANASVTHTWTNAGDYTITFTAFNNDSPTGVSTNLLLHVEALVPPSLLLGGHTGNNFTLTFTGQFWINYVLEQTTNLSAPIAWQTVSNIFSPLNGPMTVTDPRATNSARFYRIRSL
jgi:hypothetical protein